MNLGDLLDELSTNVLRDMSDIVAGPEDSLFSTSSLIRYLNEGYNKFSRDTMCIVDMTTPSVCQTTLQTGISVYPLHVSVLAVISAEVDGTILSAVRTGHAHQAERVYGALSNVLQWFSTDEDTNTLKVFPAPSAELAGKTLRLRVHRKPLVMFDESNLATIPEIPEEYHHALVDWAAYRALTNYDADAENQPRAERHREAYKSQVAECRRDLHRRRFVPMGFRGAGYYGGPMHQSYYTNGFEAV